MKDEKYTSKRSLLHLLYLLKIKNGAHKQSITLEDISILTESFKVGYAPTTYVVNPAIIEDFKEVLASVRFP